ncbi:MAG TPA: hypothetical protein VNV60_09390 [Holophagaceae bacterium]|nr:hypothetical protein [Holophagaceae bacterium]
MNGSTSKSPISFLLGALLAANLGLLWVQGAQLNRQHDTLRQLHSDIEDLTDALDAYTNGDGGDGSSDSQDGSGAVWAPASRHHARRHANLRRASYQDPDAAPQSSPPQPANPPAEQDPMDQGRKDAEDANKSARDAVAKAREDQHKLSISENYRKGQEERKIQEAQYEWTRWVWAALGFLILAFAVRAWIIKRNG